MIERVSGTCLVAVALAFVGCTGDADTADSSAGGDAAAEGSSSPVENVEPSGTAPDATGGAAVNPLMNPRDPAVNETAPATFRVRLNTSRGEVVLELHRDWSPAGVDRFYNLVRHGFYDGVRFFRVLDGFVAQFGINGDPAIQSRWRAATMPDEPVVEGNTRGQLTYAKGGPNSRSTQLFINYGDNSRLDPLGFSALGEVVEGMDVVDRLYSGYGEGGPAGSGATGPDQALIQRRGNDYLTAEFPQLDYIETAEIIG